MRAIVERHLEELEVALEQGHLTYEYYEGAKWALKCILSDLDKNDEEMMMDMMLNDPTQYENDYDEIDLHAQLAKEEYERWIKEDSEKLNALREKIANQ